MENKIKYTDYNLTLKNLESIAINHDYAVNQVIKDTGMFASHFKVLITASYLTNRNKQFSLKDLVITLRASCRSNIARAIVKLVGLGYLKKIKGRQHFGKGSEYVTTGKAEYLMLKFRDIMRKLWEEIK